MTTLTRLLPEQTRDQELVARFFEVAFRQAEEVGVQLRLSGTLDGLAEINQRNRDSWPPLIPIFDVTHNRFASHSVVMVESLDKDGRTVSTHAARLFDWPRTTLRQEATALRPFYDDPALHLVDGEFVDIPDGAPSGAITGRTACIGALWVSPEHRKTGLTKITARVVKAFACAHWGASVCWSFANPAHFASGVARAFGRVAVDHGIRLSLGALDVPAVITYQAREILLSDVKAAVLEGAIDSSRLTDTTPMNSSPA